MKVIPAGNSSFQLAQNTARSSKIQFGSTSIEYRIASDFWRQQPTKRSICLLKTFWSYPEKFSLLRPENTNEGGVDLRVVE